MDEALTVKQEHKRINGVVWGMILDLEYQQDTLHDLKLQLPDAVLKHTDVITAMLAVHIHIKDALHWSHILHDVIRLAQEDELQQSKTPLKVPEYNVDQYYQDWKDKKSKAKGKEVIP